MLMRIVLAAAVAAAAAAMVSPAVASCGDFNLTAPNIGMVDGPTMLKAVDATDLADCCSHCSDEPACV